jgi:hypothetical protein
MSIQQHRDRFMAEQLRKAPHPALLIVSPACHHTAFTDASGRYASMYALLDALAAPVPVAG